MEISVTLPMPDIQPWDSECYAMMSRNLHYTTVLHVSRDFNLLRNSVYNSYTYHPYKFLTTPLYEQFSLLNHTYIYVVCEYRMWLYLSELKKCDIHLKRNLCYPLDFGKDGERLKYTYADVGLYDE